MPDTDVYTPPADGSDRTIAGFNKLKAMAAIAGEEVRYIRGLANAPIAAYWGDWTWALGEDLQLHLPESNLSRWAQRYPYDTFLTEEGWRYRDAETQERQRRVFGSMKRGADWMADGRLTLGGVSKAWR